MNISFTIYPDIMPSLNHLPQLFVCVDVGYGWPAYKGGPLFYADQIVSLPLLLSRLERLFEDFPDSDYYSPSALLRVMVSEDVSILDLQKDNSHELIKRLREIMLFENENGGVAMMTSRL